MQSSDSSSDSEMSDDYPQEESDTEDYSLQPIDDEEYRQCRSHVDLNPLDYQARLKWIAAEERRYGKGSEKSKQAREETHLAFPCPEEFWMEWINEEKLKYKIQKNRSKGTTELTKNYITTIHDLVLRCQNDYQCE